MIATPAHILALLVGALIDLLIGDPHEIPHPVVWIGKLITVLEKLLRKTLPQNPRGEKAGGIILWFTVVFISVFVSKIFVSISVSISPLPEKYITEQGFSVRVL